jgi:N-acetylmuramoyl-L-alanine amidase
MKHSLVRTAAALAGSAILTLGAIGSAKAFTFDETEISQDRVIVIAQPRPFGGYQLLILEQVSDKRQCWSESGSNPVKVDPLLVTFDFTGICGRATDSNGFSIRMAGTDLALKYALTLETVNGDVLLMGTPVDYQGKSVIIGRTNGDINEFMKISLDPAWRLSKRAYQGRTLGHFYFTTKEPAPIEIGNTGGNTGAIPQAIPREIPPAIPQAIPQAIPTEIPQEIPTEIPQEIPTEIPQAIP